MAINTLNQPDFVEIATKIVFERCHEVKERYSYAALIAEELRQAYNIGYKQGKKKRRG